MAITTYAELKTAVATWLDRSDLDAYMSDFITLAEAYICYNSGRGEPLRVRDMHETATLSPASNEYTLPGDLLGILSATALTSPRRELDKISISGANRLYPTRYASTPANYQVVGNTLTAFPYTSADIELVYFKRLPALADDNTSNWLLVKNPAIYLRATQMMAAEFIKDAGQAGAMKQLVDQYVSQLNDAEAFDDYRNSGTTLEGMVV
tara:strand:- start:569 stop:1195 length:627 start_codon:yes stop_codon:yes gene_type:complete